MQFTAVITGGSKGIGFALVDKFLTEGFRVIAVSRTIGHLASLQTAFPNDLKVFQFDLSEKASVLACADAIIQEAPIVNVLINNAGIFLPGSVAQEDVAHFELQMALNVNAPYYLTKYILPHLSEVTDSYIFNICSTASEVAYTNGASYCISKHALLGFTKVLRAELLQQGIAVSAVLPGATFTDSWKGTSLPESRFIESSAIANAIYMAWENRKTMVMEHITLRPILGDI